MKKKIILAAMAFISLAAYSQVEVGKTFIKPTVGINIANISKSEMDSRFGLLIGGELEHGLSKDFTLSGGLFYSMQGCKESSGGVTYTVATDYINIPVMVNYYPTNNLALKFGIQPGLNLSAEQKASGGGQSETLDIDGAESIVFAIPIGVSYQISDFVIDARYNFGISNVVKDGEGKHGVFSLGVAYKLPIKFKKK